MLAPPISYLLMMNIKVPEGILQQCNKLFANGFDYIDCPPYIKPFHVAYDVIVQQFISFQFPSQNAGRTASLCATLHQHIEG